MEAEAKQLHLSHCSQKRVIIKNNRQLYEIYIGEKVDVYIHSLEISENYTCFSNNLYWFRLNTFYVVSSLIQV